MTRTVAISNVASTGFFAHNTERSQTAWAADACIAVLRDGGLQATDIDGICGGTPDALIMQRALGIPELTWFANPAIIFGNALIHSVAAVASGLADVVLAYHGAYRSPWNTGAAARDPFRRGAGGGGGAGAPPPESIANAPAYTAWASRYLHEYGATRDHLGYVSMNARNRAAANPLAAMRSPITMADYHAAPMVRWPLSRFDMDVAVDGADAFVITTLERARDLPHRPVIVDAVTLGVIDRHVEDQAPGLAHHGQHIVAKSLRNRTDIRAGAADLFFPYDGFSIITLSWFENFGYCGPGEAGSFIEQHRDPVTGIITIDGRVLVNPHGGSLGEGGTQGTGHVREAVMQLQGRAGDRQAPDARTALLGIGGFYFNSQGAALRADD